MYFGLLNPNLLWKKKFDRRVSGITSKNCRNAVFLWKYLRKKKHCYHHIKNTLFFFFGLLNPNFLWTKRFGSRISEITSKNCRKAVFLWKNLRRKKNIVSITLKTLYFMYFGLLNPNFLWTKRFGSRISKISSKNCRKAVFLWKNLGRKIKTLLPSHWKHFIFMNFGLLNPNLLWKKRFDRWLSEITSKNWRKAVFLWNNLRKKENIVSITLKTLYFYVFWIAGSKFLMDKEDWQPSFGDNLKKLSKTRVSVEKLEEKKNIVSIKLNTLCFMYFGLLNPN